MMKIRTLHAAGAAFVLFLFVAGCTVETRYPLSAQPKTVDKDKFEGVWLFDTFPVAVRFADNGVAKLATLQWEDDQFHLIHGEMVVIEGEKDNFISLRVQEGVGKWMTDYYLLQYKFTEEGYLLFWWPNQKAFAAAIEKNLLSGAVRRVMDSISGVTLTSPPDELLKFIDDPERRDLFDYRDPWVLRKIVSLEKDGQDPCVDFKEDQKSGSESDPDSDKVDPSGARSEGDL
jgi:hypothetical protein